MSDEKLQKKQERFRKYIQKQIEKIKEFKWLESEKLKKDLSADALKIWIEKYAAKFRHDYIVEDLQGALEDLRKIEIKDGKEFLELKNKLEKIEDKIEDGLQFFELTVSCGANLMGEFEEYLKKSYVPEGRIKHILNDIEMYTKFLCQQGHEITKKK